MHSGIACVAPPRIRPFGARAKYQCYSVTGLSSFRPAGAEFGTTEAVPYRSEAMNVNLTNW